MHTVFLRGEFHCPAPSHHRLWIGRTDPLLGCLQHVLGKLFRAASRGDRSRQLSARAVTCHTCGHSCICPTLTIELLGRSPMQTLPRGTNGPHKRLGLLLINASERPLPRSATNLKPSGQHLTVPAEIFAPLGMMLPRVPHRQPLTALAGA